MIIENVQNDIGFIKHDGRIPCENMREIELLIPASYHESNINMHNVMTSMVYHCINQDFRSYIKKRLLEGTIEYHFKLQPEEHNCIYSSREVFTNVLLGKGLYDSYYGFSFVSDENINISRSSDLYKIGKIANTDAYIDSDIEYNDKIAFSTNDLYYNMHIDHPIYINDTIVYKYSFGLLVGKGIVDVFIDDENSPRFSEYIIHKRSKTIDELLK